MARRKFSETEVLQTIQLQLWAQHNAYLLCYRCKEPLFKDIWNDDGNWSHIVAAIPPFPIQREHLLEIALGGEDCHRNCVYSHKQCHDTVTNGTPATTAGSSKQRIAKVRRIQAGGGRRRKGPPIKSRGFSKTSRPFPKRIKKNASP